MSHDLLKIGKSKFGNGVFANSIILRGERLLELTGSIVSYSDTTEMGIFESYPIQIDFDKYVIPESPFCYINHSCDPNCGIIEGRYLIAIKNIGVNEELFYDYSTTMLERSWEMECSCNSDLCRKFIQDFDLLPTQLQKYYLDFNIVQPFIRNK